MWKLAQLIIFVESILSSKEAEQADIPTKVDEGSFFHHIYVSIDSLFF